MRDLATLLIALLACASAVAADAPRVTFRGVGAVQIGMTTDELAGVLGHPVAPQDTDEASCFYVPTSDNAFAVMVIDGRAVRIDVASPSIATLRGARVGDKVSVVRELYGRALVEQPHFYLGLPDLYLTYFSSDRRYALRFETHDGVVSRYYIGYAEPAQYVEGCN
jgi:hypothetical protein